MWTMWAVMASHHTHRNDLSRTPWTANGTHRRRFSHSCSPCRDCPLLTHTPSYNPPVSPSAGLPCPPTLSFVIFFFILFSLHRRPIHVVELELPALLRPQLSARILNLPRLSSVPSVPPSLLLSCFHFCSGATLLRHTNSSPLTRSCSVVVISGKPASSDLAIAVSSFVFAHSFLCLHSI
jgi:hypothetical protein